MTWEDVNDWRRECGPWAIVCGLVRGELRFVLYLNDKAVAGGFTTAKAAAKEAERMAAQP